MRQWAPTMDHYTIRQLRDYLKSTWFTELLTWKVKQKVQEGKYSYQKTITYTGETENTTATAMVKTPQESEKRYMQYLYSLEQLYYYNFIEELSSGKKICYAFVQGSNLAHCSCSAAWFIWIKNYWADLWMRNSILHTLWSINWA